MVILAGKFRGIARGTFGSTAPFRLADDQRVLRVTDCMTSTGPVAQVYLVLIDDAKHHETAKKSGFSHVGELKGNQGDQNHDVPAEVDFNKYRAVTVWCRRFAVNFATAPLRPKAI